MMGMTKRPTTIRPVPEDRMDPRFHDAPFDECCDVLQVELLPHHDEQAGQHKADVEEQVGVRCGGAPDS